MLRLLASSVILSCLIAIATAGNCSLVETHQLVRDGVRYEITGGEVHMIPSSNGVDADYEFVKWSLAMLVERNRTAASGPLLPRCQIPRCPEEDPLCQLNPLEPAMVGTRCTGASTNRPCGELITHLDINDMNCWSRRVKEPFHGFERESVFITFTHPAYPNFSLVAGNHLLDGFLDYYPIPNNTFVVNKYVPNSLKISYDVRNYPFGNTNEYIPDTLNDYTSGMSIWWNMSFAIAEGNITLPHVDDTRRIIEYRSADGSTVMSLDVSTIYVADGEVFYNPDSSTWDGLYWDGDPFIINMSMATNLCNETLGKWDILEYDPSLIALFDPPPTPQSTPEGGKGKSGLTGTQIAIIATVVPIVVLLIGFAVSWTWLKPTKRLPRS